MSFVSFTIGAVAASASLWEISLALDEYSTAANSRRYSDKGMDMARGPSSLPLSTYTDSIWSKGEHPKFTDIRHQWNSAIWNARQSVIDFFEDLKK